MYILHIDANTHIEKWYECNQVIAQRIIQHLLTCGRLICYDYVLPDGTVLMSEVFL